MAAGDVVDEAAHGDGLGNPGMGAELLQLVADIFIDVLEGVEEGGSNSGGSGAILDSGAQILFAGEHQSAIGVIDDHDFLGAEQIMRYDQGAQGVFRHDTAGVAYDVRVSRFQASVRIESRVSIQVRTASLRSGRGVSLSNSCVRE